MKPLQFHGMPGSLAGQVDWSSRSAVYKSDPSLVQETWDGLTAGAVGIQGRAEGGGAGVGVEDKTCQCNAANTFRALLAVGMLLWLTEAEAVCATMAEDTEGGGVEGTLARTCAALGAEAAAMEA